MAEALFASPIGECRFSNLSPFFSRGGADPSFKSCRRPEIRPRRAEIGGRPQRRRERSGNNAHFAADGKHFGRAGVRAKKLQIVVARGLLLANIRAPFPDSGFGAQRTARLVGSWLKIELGRCRPRRFFASSKKVEVVN